MKLHMDAGELARALARSEVSSERVFGAEALMVAGCADRVPRTDPLRGSDLGADRQRLLRAAYERLLGDGAFRDVLDLLGSSEGLVPEWTSLTSPEIDSGGSGGGRPGLKVARGLGDPPRLPLADSSFDAALLSLDVGCLRRPVEVLREVARVLRRQGLVALSFGEARYDGEHTCLWAHADDREHLMLAEAFIEFAGAGFSRPTSLTLFDGAHGLEWREGARSFDGPDAPRVHLVFAYRGTVAPAHATRPPFPPPAAEPLEAKGELRFDETGRPHCPYCGERMGRYSPPVTIFEIDYGVDELYVCFSDDCEYYRRSRRWMRSQGHPGYTYRFMLNPATGGTGSIPDDLWGGLKTCRVD